MRAQTGHKHEESRVSGERGHGDTEGLKVGDSDQLVIETQGLSKTLELVELSDKADRPIKGFSGGERRGGAARGRGVLNPFDTSSVVVYIRTTMQARDSKASGKLA